MRLLDLDPQWIVENGRRVGFTFVSPKGTSGGKRVERQSCFADPPAIRTQLEMFEQLHGENAIVQPCNPRAKWNIAGGIDAADFASISVTPSLDGSAGGLWHGYITNGQIVGGV